MLISDLRKKITSLKGHVPVALERSPGRQTALDLISEEVEGEALRLVVNNKLRSTLNVCAVKALRLRRPSQGDACEDIAVILTGGKFITEDLGLKLDLELSDLGRAKSVVVEKENTTIVRCNGSPPISRAA